MCVQDTVILSLNSESRGWASLFLQQKGHPVQPLASGVVVITHFFVFGLETTIIVLVIGGVWR